MLFTGTYQNSIDSKFRITIPSVFRDKLGGSCFIARGFDECLYIYAKEDFEIFVEKMSTLKQADEENRRFIRQIFPSAQECKIDSQGRILVPPLLRSHAGIEKDVKDITLLGVLDKIEIWNTEILNQLEDEDLLKNADFVDKLSSYNI